MRGPASLRMTDIDNHPTTSAPILPPHLEKEYDQNQNKTFIALHEGGGTKNNPPPPALHLVKEGFSRARRVKQTCLWHVCSQRAEQSMIATRANGHGWFPLKLALPTADRAFLLKCLQSQKNPHSIWSGDSHFYRRIISFTDANVVSNYSATMVQPEKYL